MFETLVESSGGMKRRAGGTVLSMLVHAMVVAGAVHATDRVVKGVGVRRADTLTFVLAGQEGARNSTYRGRSRSRLRRWTRSR